LKVSSIRTLLPAPAVAPYLVATVYFTLEETDKGFEWLERAFDEYDENLNFLAVDPVMDGLRGDSRFAALAAKVGVKT